MGDQLDVLADMENSLSRSVPTKSHPATRYEWPKLEFKMLCLREVVERNQESSSVEIGKLECSIPDEDSL